MLNRFARERQRLVAIFFSGTGTHRDDAREDHHEEEGSCN